MENSKIHPARQQCPHLGLRDDPTTALAYPSDWNFCYRAKPASSIRISHQEQACLDHRFVDCPVFQNALMGAMPSELRGNRKLRARGEARGRGGPRTILWIILLAALVLLFLWFARDYLLALLF